MSTQKENEPPKQGGSNTVLIIIIVILVVIILAGFAGCGCYYMYKKAQESAIMPTIQPTATEAQTPVATSPSPTSTLLHDDIGESPADIIIQYMSNTLGTIAGANVNYEFAKDYVSYEIAQKLDDPGFVPQSYCIQNGPDEVTISSENIDGMESTVVVNANYGGDFSDMWEFLLVKGEGGWKIKSITCLDTGQVTQ